jgi:hypothetical protein
MCLRVVNKRPEQVVLCVLRDILDRRMELDRRAQRAIEDAFGAALPAADQRGPEFGSAGWTAPLEGSAGIGESLNPGAGT